MKPYYTAVPGKTYVVDPYGRKFGFIFDEPIDSDPPWWWKHHLETTRKERAEADSKEKSGSSVRKPADAYAVWVSETELPNYVPYTLKEIRQMRKQGVIKSYPDIRPGGRRVTYNLLEVSAQIRAGRPTKPTGLLTFNPDEVRVSM